MGSRSVLFKAVSLALLLLSIWAAWGSSRNSTLLAIPMLCLLVAIVLSRFYLRPKSQPQPVVQMGSRQLSRLQQLVEQGADVNQKEGNDGRTALMNAVWAEKPENVAYLLQAGADANAMDRYGRTALMEAAYWGYSEIVKMLVEAGADVRATSHDDLTAAAFAEANGHKEIAEYLQR